MDWYLKINYYICMGKYIKRYCNVCFKAFILGAPIVNNLYSTLRLSDSLKELVNNVLNLMYICVSEWLPNFCYQSTKLEINCNPTLFTKLSSLRLKSNSRVYKYETV